MHAVLMGFAVVIAWMVRLLKVKSAQSCQGYAALGAFLLPPLLLLTTSLTVLWMGRDGAMMGISAGWLGDLLAGSFLSFAAVQLLRLVWGGWRSLQQVRTYPLELLDLEPTKTNGRILETPALFAAQVGFWRSELVVSRGLLATLTPEHLQAVLTHEQAHAHYHDTFWFFWLGWLRQITLWLPHTETLWQELLLLRELRADRWAAQRVDALLIAEALLLIVQSTSTMSPSVCAAFNADLALSRLEERIEALLDNAPDYEEKPRSWLWLGLVLLPLLTVPFHG